MLKTILFATFLLVGTLTHAASLNCTISRHAGGHIKLTAEYALTERTFEITAPVKILSSPEFPVTIDQTFDIKDIRTTVISDYRFGRMLEFYGRRADGSEFSYRHLRDRPEADIVYLEFKGADAMPTYQLRLNGSANTGARREYSADCEL